MDEIFSVFKEYFSLIVAGGMVVSAIGLVLVLALEERFALAFELVLLSSQISSPLATLKSAKRMNANRKGNFVNGEKGVWKTYLFNTVTSKTEGVKLEVQPEQSQ